MTSDEELRTLVGAQKITSQVLTTLYNGLSNKLKVWLNANSFALHAHGLCKMNTL